MPDTNADPKPDPDDANWQVVASRPHYSQRTTHGRFASVDKAEALAEALRARGYRDVQIEPVRRNEWE